MAARISGFNTDQSKLSSLVTVTKSFPKKTCFTPSVWNSFFASGDFMASLADAIFRFPDCSNQVHISPMMCQNGDIEYVSAHN